MKRKSWVTTAGGLLSALGTALTLSSDARVSNAGKMLAAFGVGLLGLAARDNGKSSEDVGAKP